MQARVAGTEAPAHARGVLRTIFDHIRPDGSLNGRIYVNHLQGTDFYHANWGDALLALDAVHPDDAYVAELYALSDEERRAVETWHAAMRPRA